MKSKIVRSSSLSKKDQKKIFELVALKELSVVNIKLGDIVKKGVMYDIEGDNCLVILEGELKPEKIFEDSDDDDDYDNEGGDDDSFDDLPDDEDDSDD